MKHRYTVFGLFISLLGVHLAALALTADEQFLAAREAFRAGDKARLERLASTPPGYELEAYVDYWRLLLDLKETDATTVAAFLARHENSYVGERLRVRVGDRAVPVEGDEAAALLDGVIKARLRHDA